SELGHSEELLREWPEAFRLVAQGRPRIRVAFEEVNRLLVVPDVALKLQRARLLLCRGHKLRYQRRELVHLIDGNGEHPVHLFAPHPCLHGTAPQGSRRRQSAQLPTTKTAQPIFAWANVTFKQATVLKAVVASGTFLSSLFRERARVPSKANASKPRDPRRLRSETVRGLLQVLGRHHRRGPMMSQISSQQSRLRAPKALGSFRV